MMIVCKKGPCMKDKLKGWLTKIDNDLRCSGTASQDLEHVSSLSLDLWVGAAA